MVSTGTLDITKCSASCGSRGSGPALITQIGDNLTRAAKIPRYVKAAKRSLMKVAAQSRTSTVCVSVDQAEEEKAQARKARHEETRKRNASAQQLPPSKRLKKSRNVISCCDTKHLEADKKAFFDAIDEVLTRVCGSCGELSSSVTAKLRAYEPKSDFFLSSPKRS